MTITLGATITTRQMTPFFIYSLSSTRCCISFLHLKTFKIQFLGVPSLRYFLVCKIHIYIPMMTLSRLLTQISFLYKKFSNFRNTTYFVPNSITIWPEFHGLVNLYAYLILRVNCGLQKLIFFSIKFDVQKKWIICRNFVAGITKFLWVY